jgi:hypothetical protein
MTTQHALHKLARRLHRNLFLSVPNGGQKEIDLSRLRPAQNATLEMPVFAIQFTERAGITANSLGRFAPEPWDASDQER